MTMMMNIERWFAGAFVAVSVFSFICVVCLVNTCVEKLQATYRAEGLGCLASIVFDKSIACTCIFQ